MGLNLIHVLFRKNCKCLCAVMISAVSAIKNGNYKCQPNIWKVTQGRVDASAGEMMTQ